MAKYFTTESHLKVVTAINPNIQVEHIVPFTKTVAEMWIRPILGLYFYDYLLAAYNASGLTANEIVLVSHIQPAIAWRAASEAVISTSYQITQKGVQKQSSDNSEAAEASEIGMVRGMYVQKAEFYENFIGRWLCDNKDLFPQFISDLNKDSLIKPNKNTGNNPFYFRMV